MGISYGHDFRADIYFCGIEAEKRLTDTTDEILSDRKNVSYVSKIYRMNMSMFKPEVKTGFEKFWEDVERDHAYRGGMETTKVRMGCCLTKTDYVL